jgi:Zn-dependent alcohol dehydrogenase
MLVFMRLCCVPDTLTVDYLQGKVKVDEYVTHNYKFADINEGFDAMHVRSRCFCLSGGRA